MLPNWMGIKDQAETNNHRLDSTRSMDKTLKTLQQKVLGLIKVFPIIHSVVECDETRQLSQQFFAIFAFWRTTFYKKERRLQSQTPGQENVLFSAEDIKNEREKANLNRLPGRFEYKGAVGMISPLKKGFIFKLAQDQKVLNGRDPLTKNMELGKVEEPQAHQPIREEEDTPRDGEEPSHLASMQEMHGPTEACKQQTQRGSTVTS
jgi:hypothetical protein